MDKNPYISVIVPIYNVEKYLRKCVKSIIDQTYSNFELLLVDDGSTDSSGKICDECGLQDERIKVFHKKNGGLSDARNYGMKHAEGAYFTFIDSDDYIGERYLEELLGLILEYQADVSVVPLISFPESTGEITYVEQHKRGCMTGKEMIRTICLKQTFEVCAPGKLYNRKVFEGIEFAKGKLYEDIFTTPYVMGRCEKVAYSDSMQYFYLLRADSIMHRSVSKRDEDLFEGLEKWEGYMQKNYPDLLQEMNYRYVEDTFSTYIHRLIYSEDYLKIIPGIKNRCKTQWKAGLNNPYLGRGKKLQIRLMFFNVRFYRWFYKQWDKFKETKRR